MALRRSLASGIAAGLSLLLLTASLAFSQPSATDTPQIQTTDVDPARLDAARRFMQAAQFERQSAHGVASLANGYASNIVPLLAKALLAQKRMAEAPQLLKDARAEIEKIVENKFRAWNDRVAMGYARGMTAEQLDAISEFYRSPAGLKFISASPVNIAETGYLIIQWLTGEPADLAGKNDPAVIEAAREAIRTSQSDKMLDEFRVLMSGPPDGIEQRGDPKRLEMLRNNLARRDEMLEFMAVIWATRFTTEQLQAVTAFYRRPLATSVAEAMPAIVRAQTKITNAFYNECNAELAAWKDDALKKLGGQQQ
jgi:hypothetical protein